MRSVDDARTFVNKSLDKCKKKRLVKAVAKKSIICIFLRQLNINIAELS